jgi:hypothetical protein
MLELKDFAGSILAFETAFFMLWINRYRRPAFRA